MNKKILIIISLIISTLLAGCDSNYPLLDNVEKFYIENNMNKPLQIENLNNEAYNNLLTNIASYSRLSANSFELSKLKEWTSSVYFRKAETEDDIYYCIFSKDEEKTFLFFEKFTDLNIYRCINYITIVDNRTSTFIDDSYDYYSIIYDIDF